MNNSLPSCSLHGEGQTDNKHVNKQEHPTDVKEESSRPVFYTQSSPFSKEGVFNHRPERWESEPNSYPGTSTLDREHEEQRCPCRRGRKI